MPECASSDEYSSPESGRRYESVLDYARGVRSVGHHRAAQKTIADHGGKYLAGGFNKTLSLAGTEPPNRVVLLQFANMDAVNAWRKEGEADLENDVGEKYTKFRVYAIEGISQ